MGAGYHGGFGATNGGLQFASGDLAYKSEPELFFEYAAKRKLIDPEGMLDIVAHGSPNTIQLVINGNTMNVTARFLARMLIHSKQYGKKQEIRLVVRRHFVVGDNCTFFRWFYLPDCAVW